jgi:hypothetical protein
MKTTWIVRWRGYEEELPSASEALDRWDQLEARGIEVELFEVVAGQRRRVAW